MERTKYDCAAYVYEPGYKLIIVYGDDETCVFVRNSQTNLVYHHKIHYDQYEATKDLDMMAKLTFDEREKLIFDIINAEWETIKGTFIDLLKNADAELAKI